MDRRCSSYSYFDADKIKYLIADTIALSGANLDGRLLEASPFRYNLISANQWSHKTQNFWCDLPASILKPVDK